MERNSNLTNCSLALSLVHVFLSRCLLIESQTERLSDWFISSVLIKMINKKYG